MSDFESHGKKTCLKKEAVPSIFCRDIDDAIKVLVSNDTLNSTDNTENLNLQPEIAELERKVQCLTINHDVEIQKLSTKIKFLQDLVKSEKNKNESLQKQLSLEKSQNTKLEKVIAELKSEKFITPAEDDSINVS